MVDCRWKTYLACAVAAFLPCAVRLLLLWHWPIPLPVTHDEFSNLLAADTFASGRLTNPAHPLWRQFESFHILQQPTYASMYPAGPGAALAVGQVLFGDPWWGVLLSCAVCYAAMCWALSQFVEVEWALALSLAAALAGGPLSAGGTWMNTYWVSGAGTTGGALVIGSAGWLLRTNWKRAAAGGVTLGIGIGILMHTRPWEGLLVAVPVGVTIVCSGLKYLPRKARLVRMILPAALIVSLFAGFLALYSWRITGSPLQMPFALNRSQYAVAPYFLWEKARPAPVYRHRVMEEFYLRWEPSFQGADRFATLAGWLGAMSKRAAWILFGSTAILILAFLRIRRREKAATLLLIAIAVFLGGTCLQRYLLARYLAPILCACLAAVALFTQPLFLRLRQAYPSGTRVAMALGLVLLCAAPAFQLHNIPADRPKLTQKYQVLHRLEGMAGRHAVLVRYSPRHSPGSEWVYNAADIDGARVVWGRAMNEEQDLRFRQYFRNRHVWLVEADAHPIELKSLDVDEGGAPPVSIVIGSD